MCSWRLTLAAPAQVQPHAAPRRKTGHRGGCECLALIDAVGADPDEIGFRYCLSVVQTHWRITCRHNFVIEQEVRPNATERWCNVGELDAVRAILVSNG